MRILHKSECLRHETRVSEGKSLRLPKKTRGKQTTCPKITKSKCNNKYGLKKVRKKSPQKYGKFIEIKMLVKSQNLLKLKSLNRFIMERGILTTATWSRIENGKYDLKFSTLVKVAYLLETDVVDLLQQMNFDYDFIDE